MEEKEKTSCSVVIVIILMLMVLGLGGYIAYDKILSNKDTESASNDTEKETPETKENEEDKNEVTLTKSLNTPNTYSYKISNAYSNKPMSISLNSDRKSAIIKIDGFSDDDSNVNGEYEITGFNKKIKETFIGVIGQDLTGYVAIFLMEDDTIEYMHIFKSGNGVECAFNNKTNDGYVSQGAINGVTNIKEMHTADLTINENGGYIYITTILAVKEDGSFYDLYKTKANIIK